MSDDKQKMELADLKGIVDTVTKPVLDAVEGAALGAISQVERTVETDDLTMAHIEASIYEEVVVLCAERILGLAAEINEQGDANRADLVHLSLATALKGLGLHTGNIEGAADGE